MSLSYAEGEIWWTYLFAICGKHAQRIRLKFNMYGSLICIPHKEPPVSIHEILKSVSLVERWSDGC